jgi:Flp pilus assembly protein TadG
MISHFPGSVRCRRGRNERGQSLVEFAVASAVFFMTIFGILSMGLGIWQYNMVSNLAQEGARWAAVRGSSAPTEATSDDVNTFVNSRALGMTVVATTTWPDGNNDAGSIVRVNVQKSFRPSTAFLPLGTLTLQSTAQMIIQR